MDQAIGRRVHQLMWDRKLTARELALHVGVDPSGMGRRLRGERGWSSDEIYITAHYFGVPVGYLFGEDEPAGPVERSHSSVNGREFGRPIVSLDEQRERRATAAVAAPEILHA